MAKSMEVPTLVEVEIQKEWDGHMAIVDGYTGTLYIDPERSFLNMRSVMQQIRKSGKNFETSESEGISQPMAKIRASGKHRKSG